MTSINLPRRGPAFIAAAAIIVTAGCAADGAGTETENGGAVIVATTPSIQPSSDADSSTPEGGTAPTGDVESDSASPTDADASDTTSNDMASPSSTASSSIAPSPAARVGEPTVRLETVGTFDGPVDLVARPGDDRMYVVEQPGRIVRTTLSGDDATVVADLRDRVRSGGEQGLLGLEYSADGSTAWVDYTNGNGDTVIAEYPVDADGALDAAAERVLLTVDQPYGNHNAGDLELGPDGMLYITLGDGGSGGDPERRADDPTSLLGTLLRIDPTPGENSPYSIPPDNPFADGVDGAPEVWSFGLRNPWKIDFDPTTDDLWIADVGQSAQEEVNLAPGGDGGAGRGANFGWSAFEGTARFNNDVEDPGNTTMPVLTYPHDEGGCSISGGVVYRGSAIAELEPAYLYSDYCAGTLWALDLAGGRNLTLAEGLGGVTAVRTGPDGEAYVLTAGGTVSRIVPA